MLGQQRCSITQRPTRMISQHYPIVQAIVATAILVVLASSCCVQLGCSDVIRSATLSCNGCEFDDGLRFDVLDMMSAASGAGRSHAEVYIRSSSFAQSVLINASGTWPSGDSTYIRVSIIDSEIAAAFSDSWVFGISGRLARGSEVTIKGGRYEVPGTFGIQYLIEVS